MVVVNKPAALDLKPASGERFVFEKDSAGMGVPRGSLGKLNGFSNDVARHGVAEQPCVCSPGWIGVAVERWPGVSRAADDASRVDAG